MNTRCPHCGARFEFEERRIPKKGARVRCSSCDKAFFIPSLLMRKYRRFVGKTAGWGITVPLLAAAAWVAVRVSTPAEPTVPSLEVAGLVAEDVRGRVVENAIDGFLYVVSGVLRNATGKPLVTKTKVRVKLLDDGENPLEGATALAGSALDENELRELPVEELRDRLGRSARKWAWRRIAPEERIAFDAVFTKLPEGAVHFTLDGTAAQAPRFASRRATQPADE